MSRAVIASALCLLFLAPPAVGGDEEGARLLERTLHALERRARAEGYGFDVEMEYHGGLGGVSSGRIGRPQEEVSAEVLPGGLVDARLDDVRVVRRGDRYAAFASLGPWRELSDPVPARHRTELSTLRHLLAPHEVLRALLSAQDALEGSVSARDREGRTVVSVSGGDAVARTLAGALARPRRGGSRTRKRFSVEARATLGGDGALQELDVALLIRVSLGSRELTTRRRVTYRLRECRETVEAVPVEALRLVGTAPRAGEAEAGGSARSG